MFDSSLGLCGSGVWCELIYSIAGKICCIQKALRQYSKIPTQVWIFCRAISQIWDIMPAKYASPSFLCISHLYSDSFLRLGFCANQQILSVRSNESSWLHHNSIAVPEYCSGWIFLYFCACNVRQMLCGFRNSLALEWPSNEIQLTMHVRKTATIIVHWDYSPELLLDFHKLAHGQLDCSW